MKEIKWIIEPNYDEILAVSETTFAAKNDGKYFVRNFEGLLLYEFNDESIKDIRRINSCDELSQDLIIIERLNRKVQLFNISTLSFLNKIPYDVVQTEQYELRGNLIRIRNNRLEGLMDFQGNLIIPPSLLKVFVDEANIVGFTADEISIFNHKGELINSYNFEGIDYIPHKKLLKCDKFQNGDSNIYEEVRVNKNGTSFLEYKKVEGFVFSTGIIDLHGNEVIPFEYSYIYIQENSNYISVSKNAKVTKNGQVLHYFGPKIGLMDFENKLVLPLEYQSIWVENEAYAVVKNFDGHSAFFDLKERKFCTPFLPHSQERLFEFEELDTSNYCFRFKIGVKVGLKNRKNEIIIPADYDNIQKTRYPHVFSIEIRTEEYIGWYGFYDIILGKEVVPVKYIDRIGFGVWDKRNQQDFFVVYDNEYKVGFYKLDGSLISEPRFEDFSPVWFNEDLAPVPDENFEFFGVIDFDGNLVYDFIFDDFLTPRNKKSIVCYKGRYGIVDLS